MPSTSKQQAKTMRAAAHNPEFAAKVGIPTKVAKDFEAADQSRGKQALDKLPQRATPFGAHRASSRGKRRNP